jgi:hypothetical protein
MYQNVGLTTPRGSGTSGYVQRNLSHFKPRDNAAPYPKDWDNYKHKQRKPDEAILEHDAKRAIEVKVFELRDRLEEEGKLDDDEIDERCQELRNRLEAERQKNKGAKTDARGLKSYQVHDLAKAKIEESEKLRKALGISEDYEEGSHWKKQEERLREQLIERGNEEARRDEERRRGKKEEYSDED